MPRKRSGYKERIIDGRVHWTDNDHPEWVPRPGRPPGRLTHPLNIRLDAEIRSRMDEVQIRHGIPLTSQVEQAMREWLRGR